jgi:hypothetical protein
MDSLRSDPPQKRVNLCSLDHESGLTHPSTKGGTVL